MNVFMEARWQEGRWLDRCGGNPHHRIGNSDGVWEARGVQRCPAIDRWRPDLLEAVRATLWLIPAPALGETPPEVLPPLPADERAPAPARDETRRAIKSVYTPNEYLERWGYTSSCGKCQKMRVGFATRVMKHTSAILDGMRPLTGSHVALRTAWLPQKSRRPQKTRTPLRSYPKMQSLMPSSQKKKTLLVPVSNGCPLTRPKQPGWIFTTPMNSNHGQWGKRRTT